MYRVSIVLYKHEWKFGRTRKAVRTRAAGECFHSFFEFSQTFTREEKKENNLLTFIINMLILSFEVITTSTAPADSVSVFVILYLHKSHNTPL